MDVCVTGGAGFIGSHLVGQLLDAGATVRVMEHPDARVAHLPLGKMELIRADIRDRRGLGKAFKGCGEVYHLAANPRLWARRRGCFHQVNYLGTVNVLMAALNSGASRIVHTSTESILTREGDSGTIREERRIRARDVIGPYCLSKFRAERFAFHLARQGSPIVIVNPTLPVGPGDWNRSPPTQMILDVCRGQRRAYMDGELNLIDVRDVARGMIRAMRVGRTGCRYLLGGENLTIKEVFGCVAKLTGHPRPNRRVPYLAGLLTAYVCEFLADTITHRDPVATVTGVKLTRRRMAFDASRSLAELGLKPRPVAISVMDAVSWFRTVGWANTPLS
jgi:dihydroflavonol-4-reductase